VLQPTVELSASRIVVTFTTAPLPPGGYTCLGNKPVSVVVRLGEPIGARRLVDGACRAGSQASTTAFCIQSATRWKP